MPRGDQSRAGFPGDQLVEVFPRPVVEDPALDYLTRALELRAPERVRNRMFDTISLARSHLISSEPDRAGELITEILPAAAKWASGRVGTKLNDFRRESALFATVPAVRDAREAIADLIAV